MRAQVHPRWDDRGYWAGIARRAAAACPACDGAGGTWRGTRRRPVRVACAACGGGGARQESGPLALVWAAVRDGVR